MNGAFYIGAVGLDAQQRSLDVIAQNVANVNTNTYKRSEVRFAEIVMAPTITEGVTPPAQQWRDAGGGVAASVVGRVFAQGDLRETGKALDLAITGDGFFEILGPNGQTYLWRGGTLKVDGDGFLQTLDGLPLKVSIQVPDDVTELKIERDGRVRGLVAGDQDYSELGQLDLVMPDDLTTLSGTEGGYFRAPDGVELRVLAPGETGAGVLVQGSVEASNVDLSTELVALLLAQRAYSANAQVIQAGDQLMAIANGLKR